MADPGTDVPSWVIPPSRSAPAHENTEAISIRVESEPGRTVLRVGGEIDMMTAPTLRVALLSHLGGPGGDLVVDLDGVEFLASTGLGVRVAVAQQAAAAGSALRVVCSQRMVTRPIAMTGLDRILDLYPSSLQLPPPAGR